MKEVMRQINLIAPTDASVLITGETGTGKDFVARYIHRLSQRRDALFVKVNCPALSSSLFESELFGHSKGAFTGAVNSREGRFEMADGRHHLPGRNRGTARRPPGQASTRAAGRNL